jgi:hypothetical protein
MGQLIIVVLSYELFWYVFGVVWFIVVINSTSDVRQYLDEAGVNIYWYVEY